MSLPSPSPARPGLFTSVERAWADREARPALRLLDGTDPTGVPIALRPARRLLYDRHADPTPRAALWHQIARRARLDARHSDWPSAAVWLGLPGLRRTARHLTLDLGAEREDVEAELVTCYLEALAELDAHTTDPGSHVLRSACTRAWTLWKRTLPERAVEDVDVLGRPPVDTDPDGLWQADYEPPGRRPGLSAPLRFTVPAHRVEGVRIGALAQAWGLADTAAATGYSGRGRQVATLSLRRVDRLGRTA
ncbi:hypothetical protein ACIQNG_04875 [Streptomyces sp. NPDC091377]|uniref:hypothetical protein n=1 Tax=Streptomyces sp. NPDC091377 TaxID=3365995 RepID=UPI0037FC88FC